MSDPAFKFDDDGAVARLAHTLRSDATTMSKRTRDVVRHYGALLQTKVKAKASGRPGPNAPTGDYRRSIALRMQGNAQMSQATVGTNKPQGRRLEFGFKGTDSLGRSYNQPKYPHFGPALTEIEPTFLEALEDSASDIGGGT